MPILCVDRADLLLFKMSDFDSDFIFATFKFIPSIPMYIYLKLHLMVRGQIK